VPENLDQRICLNGTVKNDIVDLFFKKRGRRKKKKQ